MHRRDSARHLERREAQPALLHVVPAALAELAVEGDEQLPGERCGKAACRDPSTRVRGQRQNRLGRFFHEPSGCWISTPMA